MPDEKPKLCTLHGSELTTKNVTDACAATGHHCGCPKEKCSGVVGHLWLVCACPVCHGSPPPG
jgi:hypothetical protein